MTGERTTVLVDGELDLATTPDVERLIRERLEDGPVLLDLRELEFMDSTGVRLLTALRREGADVLIRGPLTAPVRQILELTEVLGVLPFDPEHGA